MLSLTQNLIPVQELRGELQHRGSVHTPVICVSRQPDWRTQDRRSCNSKIAMTYHLSGERWTTGLCSLIATSTVKQLSSISLLRNVLSGCQLTTECCVSQHEASWLCATQKVSLVACWWCFRQYWYFREDRFPVITEARSLLALTSYARGHVS